MEWLGLFTFAGVYFLAVVAPGPGVAAVIARSISSGLRGAPAFIAGFVVGDLVWLGCAATGLAILAKTYAPLFLYIKYAGCAYLLFLAFKMWTAPVAIDSIEAPKEESSTRLFFGSLALTLGNPKVVIFFVAILPTVVDLETLTLLGFVEISAIILVILTSVLVSYASLAAKARQFLNSAKAVKRVNQGSSITLVATAALIASR
jgi:threonine/homoserine/homoserine lactone efflux protein